MANPELVHVLIIACPHHEVMCHAYNDKSLLSCSMILHC